MRSRASAFLPLFIAGSISLLGAQQPARHLVTLLPTAAGVVALLPAGKPDSTLDERNVAARFDSSLRVSLTSRRFVVLDGGPALAAWLRVRDSLGGFYDRKTGHRLDSHLRSAAHAALNATGAELLIVPELEVVDAWIANHKARWDGAGRDMTGVVGGRTAAMSLVAEVRDGSGDSVAALRSGFSLLLRPKGDDLVWMTAVQVFGDEKRIRECTDRLADSMPGVPRRPVPVVPREDRPIP
jgi:hypothetical protein